MLLVPVHWLLVMDTDAIPVLLKKEVGRNLSDVPTYWLRWFDYISVWSRK